MRNCPERKWIISILTPSPAFSTWHPHSCFIQWEAEGSFKHLASNSEMMAKEKTPIAFPGSWVLQRVMVCFDGRGEVWRGQDREPILFTINTSTLPRFRDFTRHEWHLLLRFAQRCPYLALVAGPILPADFHPWVPPNPHHKTDCRPCINIVTIFFNVKINLMSWKKKV